MLIFVDCKTIGKSPSRPSSSNGEILGAKDCKSGLPRLRIGAFTMRPKERILNVYGRVRRHDH